MNNQQLWQAILGSLEVSLSKANFNTWFKNTSILERGDDHLVIGVPSAFNRDWIAAKYHSEMLKALKTSYSFVRLTPQLFSNSCIITSYMKHIEL